MAVREGMADVYVARKLLKRTSQPNKTRARGLEGAQLESALMGMAQLYPNNVKVVTAT